MRGFVAKLASALVLVPLISVPALAADSGGGDAKKECEEGQVYNSETEKCEAPKQGMIYDDESIYLAGRALAKAGRYDEAIGVLTLAADKTDARILNYLGYSHRKAGRVVVGLGYYQEALLNNPDYTLVREYMGEAYLMLGQVDKAREQLGEIEKRCGTGCAEFIQLSQNIDAHLNG
jgi:tetratricopeptide (TPR) repeat protein